MRPPTLSLPAAPLRTFIAIELPPEIKRQVQQIQQRLHNALEREQLGDLMRWTPGDNLHLTLRFLGDTTSKQRSQIEAALAALAASSPVFHLAVQKLGAFPNLRKPNIVWLGFGGDLSALSAQQGRIEAAAQAAGFAAEERAFAAHLTIARAQKNAASAALTRAGELLRSEAAAPTTQTAFRVEQIHLIRSDLRPSGPIYRTLRTFDLAG